MFQSSHGISQRSLQWHPKVANYSVNSARLKRPCVAQSPWPPLWILAHSAERQRLIRAVIPLRSTSCEVLNHSQALRRENYRHFQGRGRPAALGAQGGPGTDRRGQGYPCLAEQTAEAGGDGGESPATASEWSRRGRAGACDDGLGLAGRGGVGPSRALPLGLPSHKRSGRARALLSVCPREPPGPLLLAFS